MRNTSPRRAPGKTARSWGGDSPSREASRRAVSYQARKAAAQNSQPPEGKVWCPSCFGAVAADADGMTRRHKIPGSMRAAICEGGIATTPTKEADTMFKKKTEYAGRHRATVELVYENIYATAYWGKHRPRVSA